ncbi:uncharacterized protein LOC135370471 [Ornithodoros turicata]|uniref:uncharacterized protein LOC135370471 n=1 Tax=Ornithodoros turicata TaxID=34597 RepID=UPI003139FCA1
MTDLDARCNSKLCFHVVEFSDKSTYVVSSSWVTETIAGTYAHWPERVSKLQLTRLLRTHQSPKDTWVLHRIRILHTTDDADEAFDLLPVAEDTSNLEHDQEYQKKTRKARKRVILSDSDDDDEPDIVRGKKNASQCRVKVPPPPTLPSQLLSTHSATTRSLASTFSAQCSSGDAPAVPSRPERPSTARCTQGPFTECDSLLINSSCRGTVSQRSTREVPSLFETTVPSVLHEPAGHQHSASFLHTYIEQSPCLSPSVTPFSDSQNESTGKNL